ncbi:hypothetical protein BH11BAC3_BH11BAC3_14050 [soil metagenome]
MILLKANLQNFQLFVCFSIVLTDVEYYTKPKAFLMAVLEKKNWLLLVSTALIAGAFYVAIGYFIPRTSFSNFIILISGLFVTYFIMSSGRLAQNYLKELLILSFVFRVLFLFSMPALSDDYFRFIWDGLLSAHGTNPYALAPETINNLPGTNPSWFMDQLKAGMNSLQYYSVYPPLLQAVFYVSVKIGGANILNDLIVYRVFVLLAEAGTIYTAIKLLKHFKLPTRNILFYALNPLVNIEFSGNLHGEVFMIFLLSLAFLFLVKEQLLWSAIFVGLAISAKLLPLIFMPAIVSFLGIKKGAVYSMLVMLVFIISFLPFTDQTFIDHIATSVGLYFDKFEFNASIYYLLLWVGYDVTGVNIIFVLGKIMPLFAIAAILLIAFKQRILTFEVLVKRILLTIVAYYLFSLVVHPWYVTVLVFLTMFSRYRFSLVWSFLIMLTYSAYAQNPHREVLWLTGIEYIIVGAFIFKELKYGKEQLF